MKYRQLLLMLLVLTVYISPALAATDDLISDDEFLGFDVNHDYDVKDDLTLQKGFDYASSIPIWGLFIVAILILAVLCVMFIPSVFGWNMMKGGKAAMNENPTKAAQGIKDSKHVNREYFFQVAEGAGFIVCIVFIVGLFL